ncbi:putative cAMP-binding protein-catabolite gene activator and regulatory subunit of cAMP-dependent protein kinase [Vibrio nigripulchritudo SO65]|uniref:Crp/Fnr family transcriptional regulator n=1 Tax=Vibrio nigripulchritudo TaxID=28173 RepID=UPI0003B226EA|nr:Crp/Fnr family transcriptional regulator [Vibrio nigripulchritudo]CCN38560.1 putative cAMP-binding protein-catabolite gene activator and regulatory subunit of cAMP-dependent protein kinase [Vibrio nigripulchritudo AM115]CCN42041.1 putative cAMP-binding protein-catabolite gene activator and regulatory subunit of cAMP-dependent protein kinase [Vibrio nigripulchritudo FTn2]CCN67275.1 putative cAMP-binding protein-catabolite gene activator and regulatory subunit of cAMP-dependent protein kinase [
MDKIFTECLEDLELSPLEVEEIEQSATLLELPTRHILTHQGEFPSHVYFLLEGLCHACYLTSDGKQYSKEFYWEVDWLISFESLVKSEPSPYLLESLTPIKLLSFPVELIERWRAESHPLYIRLLETQLMYKEGKERFMLLHSPEEKYSLFCETYPELLSRVTDYQIAAYLGITHISLSRIKKRIKDKINKS